MLKFGAPLQHFLSPLWHFIKNEKKSPRSHMYTLLGEAVCKLRLAREALKGIPQLLVVIFSGYGGVVKLHTTSP